MLEEAKAQFSKTGAQQVGLSDRVSESHGNELDVFKNTDIVEIRERLGMMRSMGSVANPVIYSFIDGAYLDQLCVETGERFFGVPLEIDHSALKSNSQKVFYYDCLPAKRGDESVEDFERRVAKKSEFFDRLRSYDGWHVAEGTGRWKRGRGASQKEVDILIAVDMLSHTHRRNMDQLVFIAGDLDFRPLLDAVVNDGMYVTLWYGPRSTSRDLRHSADSKEELDIFRLYNFCTLAFRQRYPLPQRSRYARMEGRNLSEIGRVDGREVAYVEQLPAGGEAIWAVDEKQSCVWRYAESSLAELKRVQALCHVESAWTPTKPPAGQR